VEEFLTLHQEVEAGRKPRPGLKPTRPTAGLSLRRVEAERKPRPELKRGRGSRDEREAPESRQGENPDRD